MNKKQITCKLLFLLTTRTAHNKKHNILNRENIQWPVNHIFLTLITCHTTADISAASVIALPLFQEMLQMCYKQYRVL